MSSLDLLRPDWPAPAGVRAACSTRAGGISGGGCESLNLGNHVGDEAASVAENRRRYQSALGVRPVFLRQVHGVEVCRLDGASVDGETADGCTTVALGVACTIMVADCLPVLFCDTAGRQVAAAHAGWRGLAGGVLENTLSVFGQVGVIAWLGPCIGPKAFEVGPEVKAALALQDAGTAACFRPAAVAGKWLADLPALARRRLARAGLGNVYGNDGSDAWCTVANPSRFFSHRRDGGSGRFAASIWRT